MRTPDWSRASLSSASGNARRAPARPLPTALPDEAIAAIREVIPALDRQLKGFAMHHAVLTGVETRTS